MKKNQVVNVVKKHWPWMVGAGVVLGLFILPSRSSGGGGGYYEQQIRLAELAQSNAAANAMTQAEIMRAGADASLAQSMGQAEVIGAQAGAAYAIGEAASAMLSAAIYPQLFAMEQSGETARMALNAAAMNQMANMQGISSAVVEHSRMAAALSGNAIQSTTQITLGDQQMRSGMLQSYFDFMDKGRPSP